MSVLGTPGGFGAEDAGFSNPLFDASPRRGFNVQHSNPTWSPVVLPAPMTNDRQLGAGFDFGTPIQAPPTVTAAELATGNRLPPAAGLHSSDRSQDEEFADVLTELMLGQLSAAEAVRSWALLCRHRAVALREEASGQLQRATRYMHLRDEANALDSEAATWHLLWHLYGVPDAAFPGGLGGQALDGVGGRRSAAQRIADIIAENETLNRAARVVAWLEFLAGEALDAEEAAVLRGGGTAGRFAPDEGLWKESRIKLASGVAQRPGEAALVTELDPDAPLRQGRSLAPDNVKDEERLMARLWRLVRAGRVREARRLCEETSQHWRSASLGGGGPAGPIPLGAAAYQGADMDDEGGGTDDEDDGLESLAVEVDSGDATLRTLWRWTCYQAAEQIGARAQPGRRGPSAEQLEAAIYGALCGHVARVLPVCRGWEDTAWAFVRCWLEVAADDALGYERNDSGIGLDVISKGLSPNGAEEGVNIGVLAEGLDSIKGGWPVSKITDAIPESYTSVFTETTSATGAQVVRDGLTDRQRRLQADLILAAFQPALEQHLLPWVMQGADDIGGQALAGYSAMMRFGAHFVLALRALEAAPDSSPELDFSTLEDITSSILQSYVVHLISAGQHTLIPQYCCHLRKGARHVVYTVFLTRLTSAPMADCQAAWLEADGWFAGWEGGDMASDEMSIISEQVAAESRVALEGGPAFRAQSARWLMVSGTMTAAALHHTSLLAREMALGGIPAGAAAWMLLHQVLPESLQEALRRTPEEAPAAGVDPTAFAAIAEARVWMEFFDMELAYHAWDADYQQLLAAESSGGTGPSARQVEDLAERTVAALQAGLNFLRARRLDDVPAAIEGGDTFPLHLDLLLVPEEAFAAASPSQQDAISSGAAFASLSEEGAAAAAAALEADLAACLSTLPALQRQGLQLEVSATADPAGSLIRISLTAANPAAQTAAAQLLGAALKGGLLGAEGGSALGPLLVVNMEGAAGLVAPLLRCMLYPRLVLYWAQLRQAAVELGAPENGSELLSLVAGVGCSQETPADKAASRAQGSRLEWRTADFEGLAPHFSRAEMQQLLERERGTALLLLRGSEAM